MLDLKPLNRILFLDIETTSQKENFSDLSEHQQEIFLKRFKKDVEARLTIALSAKVVRHEVPVDEATAVAPTKTTAKKKKEVIIPVLSIEEIIENTKKEILAQLYNEKAPIFPEFGRILCISVGALWQNKDENFFNLKISTFSNEDEKVLLEEFINHEKLGPIFNALAGKYDKNQDTWALCAFNGKVFDFPYIAKRLIINGFQLPAMFDYAHLKPWEQLHIIDPKEAWSFSVFDAAVSLDCLADIFNIPSSKDDIDGSEVKDVFWKEKNLSRIVTYCEKDIKALAEVYLRMKSMKEEIRVFSPVIMAVTDQSVEKTEETPA